MKTKTEIQNALRDTASRLSTARGHLAANEMIDLVDLESGVNDICTAIADLPDDERKGLQKPLAGLLDELDKLTKDLRAQYDGLKKDLKAISDSGRVVRAYGPGDRPGRE